MSVRSRQSNQYEEEETRKKAKKRPKLFQSKTNFFDRKYLLSSLLSAWTLNFSRTKFFHLSLFSLLSKSFWYALFWSFCSLESFVSASELELFVVSNETRRCLRRRAKWCCRCCCPPPPPPPREDDNNTEEEFYEDGSVTRAGVATTMKTTTTMGIWRWWWEKAPRRHHHHRLTLLW